MGIASFFSSQLNQGREMNRLPSPSSGDIDASSPSSARLTRAPIDLGWCERRARNIRTQESIFEQVWFIALLSSLGREIPISAPLPIHFPTHCSRDSFNNGPSMRASHPMVHPDRGTLIYLSYPAKENTIPPQFHEVAILER